MAQCAALHTRRATRYPQADFDKSIGGLAPKKATVADQEKMDAIFGEYECLLPAKIRTLAGSTAMCS